MQILAPNGIAHIGAANRPGGLFEPAAYLLENRLFAHPIPPNTKPVIFEIHLTRAVVMRHNEKRLRIANGTVMWAKHQAVQFSAHGAGWSTRRCCRAPFWKIGRPVHRFAPGRSV
jgi:hypothetical protein